MGREVLRKDEGEDDDALWEVAERYVLGRVLDDSAEAA